MSSPFYNVGGRKQNAIMTMTGGRQVRTWGRLPWVFALCSSGLGMTGLVLIFLNRKAVRQTDLYPPEFIFALAFSALGALVASRRRANPIGWILLGVGVISSLDVLANPLAIRALLDGGPASAWARWAALEPRVGSTLTFFLLLPLLLLLFPDGKAPRRWRWLVPGALVTGLLGAAENALDPTPLEVAPQLPKLSNPIGVQAFNGFANGKGLGALAGVLALLVLVLSATALVLRLRGSKGEEHQQLKWFAYASMLCLAAFLSALLIPGFSSIGFLVFALALGIGIPGACALAILKYGLYEIEVVISKTLLYGLLAAFFTIVYVAMVVGIGSLIGSTHNTFLTILAATVMAVAFNPVRERAKRFADRLAYGKRATPYEVLGELSDRMAGSYPADDMVPRMAKAISDGTGGRAEVWLRLGDALRSVATWPDQSPAGGTSSDMSVHGQALPEFPGVSKTAAVLHQGELLGAITVSKPSGDPLRPAEDKLIDHLASQAGLVLRNERLTAELRVRLEELRASRQRIVAAQDAAARRLERNIHDGAQQQLVALAVKANLARSLVGGDDAKQTEILHQLSAEAQDALENLRDLARGIYPPLLADRGLVAAVESQARKSAVPVKVESDGIGRYSQETEAAVYFCCLEALQNIAKYADARAVRIALTTSEDVLGFQVFDDGRGFDTSLTGYGTGLQGMADRLAALDGQFDISSIPGRGTTVAGRLPARAPGSEATRTPIPPRP